MDITATDANNLLRATQLCRERKRNWEAQPPRHRLRSIRVFRKLLISENARLTDAVGKDIGKPAAETLACEVMPLAEACRYLERHAPRILRPQRVPLSQRPLWLWGQRDTIFRRPRGVVGIIGTWNFPIFLNGVQILQALTAGNAVVWKPSEVTPASSEALWDLLMRSDLPDGLLARLPGTREAGKQLAEADIDHVVFTGHADTGRLLAATLGRRLISSTLELSGLDAMLVLEDADVALAAKAAWFGASVNAGQTCLAVRRVFVDRRIYEPFLAALKPLVASAAPMQVALPSTGKSAAELVHQAVKQGARLLDNEEFAPLETPPDRHLFRPLVVADARPEMGLCQEATFVPVMAVLPFDRLDDAMAAQDQCTYGLGASIFTASPARALRLADRLPVGMVTINDVVAPTGHPATPFGGRRTSGWGVTQGALGLLEMTVPQVVSTRGGSLRPHYDPPDSTWMTSRATLEDLLRCQYGVSLVDRAKSAWRLMRGAVRLAAGTVFGKMLKK